MTDLSEILSKKSIPLVLDGAMGSLLTSSGIEWDDNLWSSYANISHPSVVRDLHSKYIRAGADIITTNTFRTNPLAHRFSNIDISLEHFVSKGVELALEAVENSQVVIAGSNAPAEDCYQEERTISLNDLEYNHKKHIELLVESGVDIVLNETQGHLDEIELICRYCSDNDILFIISLFFTENGKLLSGEDIREVVNFVKQFSPFAIGFNCIFPETFLKYQIIDLDYSWGFYLNCGSGKLTDKNISCGLSPKNYALQVQNLIDKKTMFVGSCCGSTPEFTKYLKDMLNEID
jgi:methionine synthase I (cobalamin-dependent)